MKTIWKWTLAVADAQVVELPVGAEILAVQMQGGLPQVWALCDPDAPKRPRHIVMFGTGHSAPDQPGRHIGTFQTNGGAYVWHAFEVTR